MPNTSSENFLDSPTQRVAGLADTPEQLASTLRALADAGFPDGAVEVLCGEAGLRRFDASGEHQGLSGRLTRITERLFGDDHDLTDTEDALRAGKYLVAVLAPTADEAERARAALGTGGAHAITRFGRWTTTHMQP